MSKQATWAALAVLITSLIVFSQGPGTADSSGAFAGTVYAAEDSTLISGAKVILSLYSLNPVKLDSFLTGDDGLYHFDSLLTGRRTSYTITVTLPGYADAMISGLTLSSDQTDTVDVYLTLPDTSTPSPSPIGAFTGTVYDSISEEPIANALVLLSGRTSTTWELLDSLRTGEDGVFLFDSVAASDLIRYSISVSAQNYAPESNTGLYADSGVTDTVDFNLVSLDTSNGWLVYGIITADSLTGDPVANAALEIVQRSGSEYRYTAVTDKQGVFMIYVLAAERSYSVTITAEGFLTETAVSWVSADSTELNYFLDTDTLYTGLPAVRIVSSPVMDLFPNPANTTAGVRGAVPLKMEIYNTVGQRVAGAINTTVLETRALPNGNYVVKASFDGKCLVKKLVIRR